VNCPLEFGESNQGIVQYPEEWEWYGSPRGYYLERASWRERWPSVEEADHIRREEAGGRIPASLLSLSQLLHCSHWPNPIKSQMANRAQRSICKDQPPTAERRRMDSGSGGANRRQTALHGSTS